MSDLTLGITPELLLLGHEEEIDSQVSEILLQDFNDFQNATFNDQNDSSSKINLMEEAMMGDMFYPSANPSDITGQSLAAKMKDDKNKVLNSMAISHQSLCNKATSLKAVENKPAQQESQNWMDSTIMELEQQDTNQMRSHSAPNGVEETQEVIAEIQEFLDQYVDDETEEDKEASSIVDELLSLEQKETLQSMDMMECPLANSTMQDEETAAAEDLLDQLMKGNFTTDEIQQLEQQQDSSQNDTGYASLAPSYDVSNVSQIITDDGGNVIIVIAPSNSAHNQISASIPSKSTAQQPYVTHSGNTISISEMDGETSDNESNHSSDSEWLPDHDQATNHQSKQEASSKKKPGRKLQERKTSNASKAISKRITKMRSINDRKERKKWQNVEAARRYRDKKKAEEAQVGAEESALIQKNVELKGKLHGIEGELNTLKKLMKELGLIKFVTPKSSSHAK